MTCSHYHSGLLAALLVYLCCGMQVSAADWSTTELQYQYGNLKKPFQGGGSDANTGGTPVLTFQHASGGKYGDTFFLIGDYQWAMVINPIVLGLALLLFMFLRETYPKDPA